MNEYQRDINVAEQRACQRTDMDWQNKIIQEVQPIASPKIELSYSRKAIHDQTNPQVATSCTIKLSRTAMKFPNSELTQGDKRKSNQYEE